MNLSELKTPAELEDLYHPVMAEIKEVKRLSAMETYYRVELPGGADLGHRSFGFLRRCQPVQRYIRAGLRQRFGHCQPNALR